MIAAVGFYEHTGDWMYTSGIPAKTGVGGGVMGGTARTVRYCRLCSSFGWIGQLRESAVSYSIHHEQAGIKCV